MKVSFYELLGMIKEDKQPNHIRYRDESWWWGYDTYTYFADLVNTPDNQTSLFSKYRIDYCLNDEVEIIEDNKKIEKIEIDEMNRMKAPSTDNFVYTVSQPMKIIIKKINEIIDKLNEMNKDV